MTTASKQAIKSILGQLPLTAELYWLLRQQGKPIKSRFSLKGLQANLPEIAAQATILRQSVPEGKKVFVFATLHFWIEHAALLSATLAAQGHRVSLGFLPYADWQTNINRFDLRRQNAYAKKVLGGLSLLVQMVPFLEQRAAYKILSPEVLSAVEQVTNYDAQYTLQVEDVDPKTPIYRLRLERNEETARVALAWLQNNRPDVVIIPNGTIQELGVVYRVARSLGIPTVTYEFGDQRQRIWMARNSEVMRQETNGLWEARKDMALSETEMGRLRSLFSARQHGTLWENFARRWQDAPASGGEQARQALGLDERPVVLLATNVLGDSLTLGRQLFSRNMAEWISRTVQYFAGRPDVQLVIRVHPGEALTHGVSMAQVVKSVLPHLPEYIRLVEPKDNLNTYDLVEVADLGLVYTTTIGLEMAMNGQPVVVSGQTHYRGRGFTIDPDSWVSYYKTVGQILQNPQKYRLKQEQVERAWRYAYNFFFVFPRPFPWHLVRLWEDYRARPLDMVLSPEGLAQYGDTLRYLTGDEIRWGELEW